MLKACWLVCPCSSVPVIFPLFSTCVCLLRLALCLRPFLSTGFSFGSLLFCRSCCREWSIDRKVVPALFWLLIILRKLNLFHLFSLLSTLCLLPVFPFPFFHSDERIKERNPMFPCYLHILSSHCLFLFRFPAL